MGLLIFLLGFFVLFGLIALLIICLFTKDKFRKKLFFIPPILWVLGIAVTLIIDIPNSKSEIEPPNGTMSLEAIKENNETEESTTQESEEIFRASCEEIGYKSLLRTPDEYIGQRIIVTAKIRQILDGSWLSDEKYYRIQTDNDGHEWYLDDEYFMYDAREEEGIKLLEDDVIKIYAEFVGLEEIQRAFTGSKEEVPAIRAKYIELISE